MKAEQGGAEPRLWGKLTRSGAEDFNDYKSDERTAGGCKAELVKRNLSGNSAGRPPELSDRRLLRHRAPIDYCLTRRNRGRGKRPAGGETEERRSGGVARTPGCKVECPTCKRGFSRQYNCQRHERAVHGGAASRGGPLKTEPRRGGPPKGKSQIGGGRAHRCPECGKGYTYLACFLNHERICRAESDSNKKRGTGSLEAQGLRGAARQRRRETRQRRRETRQRCRETRQRCRETRQRCRETRQRCRETRGGDARDGEPAPREHSRQVKKEEEEEERGKGKHGRERGVTHVKQEVTPQKIHAAPRGDSTPPTGMETRIKVERVEVELEHRGEERRTELGKGGEEREEAEVSRWGCGEEKHRGTTEPQVARASRDARLLDCLDCGAAFLLESELHQHYMDHAREEG